MFEYILNRIKQFRKPSRIQLGICAMDKKTKSKPMKEILGRLPEELFEVIIFGNECILNKEVEDWPVVECLIAFYSDHFPMEKVSSEAIW